MFDRFVVTRWIRTRRRGGGSMLLAAVVATSCASPHAVAETSPTTPPATNSDETGAAAGASTPDRRTPDLPISIDGTSARTPDLPADEEVVSPSQTNPVPSTVPRQLVQVPFAPVTSPDVGDHCADGLDAASLTAFFAQPIGEFDGADYQRAQRLGDGRVLWTFQDAFIGGALVHNAAMIQSGRCFTLLNEGRSSWLLPDATSHMVRWHWILDGALGADGTAFHLFVVEMTETGPAYLSRSRPTALRRVVLDTSTFDVVDIVDERIGDDSQLFGWSVTNDASYTYLYSHCYQQFGHGTELGFAPCVVDVKLARTPRGVFDGSREYWTGRRWSPDPTAATPVVDGAFVVSGNNPAQVRFDGERFLLVEKRDDWWGNTVEIGTADDPQGPFRHVATIEEPTKCERSRCNTYFAAWVPWRSSDGHHIWSIGHNVWNGQTTQHLEIYRPTFHEVELD